MKQSHRVRAAANAGNDGVGKTAFHGHNLLAGLLADHRLKVADHLWIGMWPGNRADDVEMRLCIGHPIAQGFIHRVFQRAGA